MGSAGAVDGDFCQVCYADVDVPMLGVPQPILHPSVPPRFSNVVEELREIGTQEVVLGDKPPSVIVGR